jgi:chemotaxis family two-component system sensor kinase Cph1
MTDLTDCDREPVHILGTIQSYGVLLVLTEPALTVAQVSDNVGDHFSLGVEAVLGRPLSVLLDPVAVDEVRVALREERGYEVDPLHLTAAGKRFDGILHRHDNATILELEPDPLAATIHHPLRAALLRIQRASTLPELAAIVVEEVRRVSGFERVMFYRFHADGHGSVDAEAKDPGLEPFLGLHYPASDIPAQVRRLYLRNWLRLIFDARAKPARIEPALRPDTGGPLDLSGSVLRGVSPIHLEYMANMGTRSAMSISLVVREGLWGLISCVNHTCPWRVPHATREACEVLGRLTSLQIDALDDRALLALRASRRATVVALATAMRQRTADGDLLEALFEHPAALMALVAADGAALVSTSDLVTCGATPAPEHIRDIAAKIDARGELGPFATSSIGVPFPDTREDASGVLTFALPGTARRRLLWFRAELIKTVDWGGDPTKPIAEEGELRPRRSFAAWREEMRFHSHPWIASDLEAADELRRHAIEIDIERRLASEERAVRARDELIAVVSHDLKTPLTSILMQAEVMGGGAAGAEDNARLLRVAADRIQRAANHMKAMIDDLLDLAQLEAQRFALHLQPVESRSMVEEAVRNAAPLAEAKQITLAVQLLDSPSLSADPERMFRVLSNLLGNAIKFSPVGGTITVRAERIGAELWITVVDRGSGIPADQLPYVFDRYWQAQPASQVGTGLGLYIAKGIVEGHGGRIWAECSGGSTRFTFTLPLPAS